MLREWWKRFVFKRYMNQCAIVGDAESYWYMGETLGYHLERRRLAFWSRKAKKLGFRLLTVRERVEYGGYGILPKKNIAYLEVLTK